MAFTQEQRVSIRHYLGWSTLFVQFDTLLERAMNALEQVPEAVTLVLDLVTKLDTLSTELISARERLMARKVGSIELPGDGEIVALRSEGQRFAGQLAAILGVTIRHDVFSPSSPTAFASRGGMSSPSGYLKIG